MAIGAGGNVSLALMRQYGNAAISSPIPANATLGDNAKSIRCSRIESSLEFTLSLMRETYDPVHLLRERQGYNHIHHTIRQPGPELHL